MPSSSFSISSAEVSTASSAVMIEAAFLDRPVVNVGLHSFKGLDAPATLVEEFTHIQQVLGFRASRNARTFEELLDYVRQYLATPNLDREERRRLVDGMVDSHRGCAAPHIAGLLEEMASKPRDEARGERRR